LIADAGASESLLLELLDLFVFFVATGATLAGCFFFLSSSDESEDEDSFVFLFTTAGDGGTTLFFTFVTATGAKKIVFIVYGNR
jgi:FtsH-binding integral membrane protein